MSEPIEAKDKQVRKDETATAQPNNDLICARKGCGLELSKHHKGFYGRRWCPAFEAKGKEKLFKEPVAPSDPKTVASDTSETAAMISADRAYINGARYGWRACAEGCGDEAAFLANLERRQKLINEAKADNSESPKAAEPSAPTITARQLIDELWAEYHEDGPFTHKGLECVLEILESEVSNVGKK